MPIQLSDLDPEERDVLIAAEAMFAGYLRELRNHVLNNGVFDITAIANADGGWEDRVDEFLAVLGSIWLVAGASGAAFEDFERAIRVHLLAAKNGIVERLLDGEYTGTFAEKRSAFYRATQTSKFMGDYERLALTSATATVNGAEFSMARPNQVKVWVSRHDGRTRMSHLEADGQTVALYETFNVGGWPGRYPGDPALPVWEVANCRCRLEIQSAVVAVSWSNGNSGYEGLQAVPSVEAALRLHLAQGKAGRSPIALHPMPQGDGCSLSGRSEGRSGATGDGAEEISGQAPSQDLRDDPGAVGGDVREAGSAVPVVPFEQSSERGGLGDGPLPLDGAGQGNPVRPVQLDAGLPGEWMGSAGSNDTEGVPEMNDELIAATAESIEEPYERGLPNGWRGPIAALNIPTGDGRQLNLPEGGLRTREYPMTFTRQHVGPGVDIFIGTIEKAWVEGEGADARLWGEGYFDLDGVDGREASRLVAQGMLFTTSIHPDEVTFEQMFLNPEGEYVSLEDATTKDENGFMDLKEGYKVLDVMTDWRLASNSLVSVPAFDEARIQPVWGYSPVPEPHADKSLAELLEEVAAYDGDDEGYAALARAIQNASVKLQGDETEDDEDCDTHAVVAGVSGATNLPVAANRKHKWDGHKARQRVAAWASSDGSGDLDKINWSKYGRAFLWRGEPNSGNSAELLEGKDNQLKQEDFKLGIADIIDGKLAIVPNAIWATAAGHGVTATKGIPDDAKDAIKKKICTLYARVRKVHATFPACPFEAQPEAKAEIVAGAGQAFKRANFANPDLHDYTPLTVTEDGRVFGHLATWDSCYSFKNADPNYCLTPPRNDDYSNFLVHGARMEDGEIIPVGALTFGDGHTAKGGLQASQKHYADVSSIAAKVTCGQDDIGIWVSGEVLDGYRDRADDLLLSPLSGHWEPDPRNGGQLAMIAAHIVVTPGFRVPYLVSSFDPETGENGLIVYTQPAGEDKAAAAKAHFVRSSLHTKFRAK